MEGVQIVVLSLLGLLIAVTLLWMRIRRHLDPEDTNNPGYHRLNQYLIVLMTVLVLLIPLLIIFSSDPGNPDSYQLLP